MARLTAGALQIGKFPNSALSSARLGSEQEEEKDDPEAHQHGAHDAEDPTGIGGSAVVGVAPAGVDGAHFLVAHVPGDRGQDAADHDAENGDSFLTEIFTDYDS